MIDLLNKIFLVFCKGWISIIFGRIGSCFAQ